MSVLDGLEPREVFRYFEEIAGIPHGSRNTKEIRDYLVEFANKNNIPVYSYEFMKDSFDMINEIMEDGDVVLLSPASASWDQYKECEVRGDEFCELVNNLK